MDKEKISKEDLLKKLKEDLSKYVLYVFVFWCVLFLGFVFWWILDEFEIFSNDVGFTLNSLNSMGGTFNIITALTGVVTIWLLSQAVYYQKMELIEIKELMKAQDESVKSEEKINRTIKEIDRYMSIKRASDYDNRSYSDIERLCNAIDWIDSINANRIKEYIDVELIMDVVYREQSLDLLNTIIFDLNSDIRELWDNIDIRKELQQYQRKSTIGVIMKLSDSSEKYIKAQELVKKIEESIEFILKFK